MSIWFFLGLTAMIVGVVVIPTLFLLVAQDAHRRATGHAPEPWAARRIAGAMTAGPIGAVAALGAAVLFVLLAIVASIWCDVGFWWERRKAVRAITGSPR